MALALGLPDDVWMHIVDFAESSKLCEMCRSLWQILYHRHVSLWLNHDNYPKKMAFLKKGNGQVVSLRVHMTSGGAAFLDDLRGLRTLSLFMADALMDRRAMLIDSIASLQSLETLHLWMAKNRINSAGARRLSRIRTLPNLTSLNLDLCDNRVDDQAAKYIATLRELPSLESLYLGLRGNAISDNGALALSRLNMAPKLRHLRLELDENQIHNFGATVLTLLLQSTSLQSLDLRLCRNDLTSVSVRVPDCWHALQVISIDLRHNPLTRECSSDLDGLSRTHAHPAIEVLQSFSDCSREPSQYSSDSDITGSSDSESDDTDNSSDDEGYVITRKTVSME